MPAVAEVQFKAAGSQQVVTAFNSVGSAAQTSSTKIQQNSSAMKSMGQGMKSSVSGIGQVAGAFATLSLSIVSTWRAYRDLGDAQIAVDKANLRVKKTTEAIRKTEAEIVAIKKEGAKGGLEDQRRKIDLTKLTVALTAAQKKYGKNSLQAADAQLKLKEAQAQGAGSSKKLTDAENKLQLQKEQLGVQTDVAKEAQERFNDTQQNFYLSILPTALSSFSLLTSAVKGFGSAFKFGPIGLILGGITLAIIAFKTNFLGLRDAVGGVIKWLQDRFGAWKDTIQEVFGFIQKGDWSGAFDRIKKAAADFWADLVKSVPLFGGIQTLVDQISKGDWAGAFNTIRDAAVFFWTELKKAIPLFGTIETVIKNISQGKWEEAFKTIGDSIMKGLQSILGADLTEKIVLKFQLMKDSAYAELNLMKDAFTKKGGPIDLINQGLAKLGGGDVIGGFSQIWTGLDKAIGIFITRVNDWVKLNFGIDLVALGQQANAIGVKILDGIKGGLTFVARTWIDPVLTQLLDPQTWIQGFIAMGGFFVKIGTALYTAIGTALGNAAKDPKGAATWWGDLGNAIWTGLSTWFSTNLPSATKAMQALAQSLTNAVEAAKADLGNVGIAMWNAIIEGIRTLTGGGASLFGGALDALKKSPIDLPVNPVVTPEGETAIQAWVKNANPLEYPTEPDQSVMQKNLNTQLGKVFKRGGYVVPKIDVDADTKLADQKAKAQRNAIDNMHATIKVSARATGGGFAGLSGGVHLNQHGYQGTVKRPTAFIAGEGGRPEDVTVRPRGSVQRGGSGGGSTHITISFEPQEFAQFIRYRINDNQGVVK